MYDFFTVTFIVLVALQIISTPLFIMDGIYKKDCRYLLIPLCILVLLLLNIMTINYHEHNKSLHYFGQTNITIKNGKAKYQDMSGEWINANDRFDRNFREEDLIYYYNFDPNPLNQPVFTTYKNIQELKNGKRN